MQKALRQFADQNYADCTAQTTEILAKNPRDAAAWLLKTRSLIEEFKLLALNPDDIDIDFDPSSMIERPRTAQKSARPGTSLNQTPGSKSGAQTASTSINRPETSRICTGYIRPMTAVRGSTSTNIPTASMRIPTSSSHIMSSSGRLVRLGTASLVSGSETEFINPDRLDLKRFATKPALSRALFEYIYIVLGNIPKALELATHANIAKNNKDWWWKLQMSKCYIRLKMYRDAERQLKSSLEDQDMLLTRQYLAKVYLQMDQPKMALRVYDAAIQAHPYASAPHVSKARVYELLNDFENSNRVFKEVLQHDECNIEVMSCLAANYFQRDQFDIAERYFRRILQVNGKESCELWNNIGLCGFFSQQFQTSISCFERALSLATNDAETADIWFNISHIAIHVGDFSLCRESLALATTYNPSHGEAWNNLAVVEYIATKNENLAKTYFKTSTGPKSNNHEPFYNLAVVELAQGNIELCVENIDKSLDLTPNHELSQKLKNQLEELLI